MALKDRKALCRLIGVCLIALVVLSGCRTRTGGVNGVSDAAENAQFPAAQTPDQSSGAAEDSPSDPSDESAPGGRTVENPDAERKEYDENAQAEITPGTDRPLHGEGEGGARPYAAALSVDWASTA